MSRLFPAFVTGRGAVALLLLRLLSGVALMHHGWGKIQNPFHWMDKADAPAPAVFQALAALSEWGGGLALVAGLLTPVAAFGIACTMAVAVATHLGKGQPFIGQGGSWELAGVYLVNALTLLLLGPGALSVDARLFNKRG